MGSDGRLLRYLPPEFATRLPLVGGHWRGRMALLLWALGYPLEMAWSLAMTDDPLAEQRFEQSIARLDDARLLSLLEATRVSRGDGSHLAFVTIGS